MPPGGEEDDDIDSHFLDTPPGLLILLFCPLANALDINLLHIVLILEGGENTKAYEITRRNKYFFLQLVRPPFFDIKYNFRHHVLHTDGIFSNTQPPRWPSFQS